MRKRRILTLALAVVLAAAVLSGCGGSGGEAGIFGWRIFFTRTASDEEAFSHVMESYESEEIVLDDASVPLAGLPGQVSDGQVSDGLEPAEEGWLLVRYARAADGTAVPLWYRFWTSGNCWSQENIPCEGVTWRPVVSVGAESKPEAKPVSEPKIEVRPLG